MKKYLHKKLLWTISFFKNLFIFNQPNFKRKIEIKPETIKDIKEKGVGVQWE